MPLYEYECGACGHRFERIQKFSDPPVEECPNCGKKSVQKLMSSPAIQFKGSGWYITDYARASKDSKDSKESKESKESGKSKESGESKESKTSAESKESSKDSKAVPTPKASGE
jgi:putative FmdB family regulatory protein